MGARHGSCAREHEGRGIGACHLFSIKRGIYAYFHMRHLRCETVSSSVVSLENDMSEISSPKDTRPDFREFNKQHLFICYAKEKIYLIEIQIYINARDKNLLIY